MKVLSLGANAAAHSAHTVCHWNPGSGATGAEPQGGHTALETPHPSLSIEPFQQTCFLDLTRSSCVSCSHSGASMQEQF